MQTVNHNKQPQEKESGENGLGLQTDLATLANKEKIPETEKKARNEEKGKMVGQTELKGKEPVAQMPVIPRDIYVIAGCEGKIKCYFENADEYIWEYYDEEKRAWDYVSKNSNIHLAEEMDDLNRNVSTLNVQGIEENDGLLVRCKVLFQDKEEDYKASFHLLQIAPEDIEKIEVDGNYKAEAGTYISTLDIPINIVKKDGSKETVTGLDGLFFCVPRDISSDMERMEGGITVETVTTTAVENEYFYVEAGESEILLRYRGMVPCMDIGLILEGFDNEPPEVEVKLSEYGVDNAEEGRERNITAEIEGMDNYTLLTNLQYAFKPKNEKVTDDDFSRKSKIEVEVNENEVWTAYVRDEAGNIGSKDIEVITLDQKPPLIKSVSLKWGNNEWQRENTIMVEAEDKTFIEYSFACDELGIDSGWLEENEYRVEDNGAWKVKVRDAAGNETSAEIKVTNIDRQPPIIFSITVKENDR